MSCVPGNWGDYVVADILSDVEILSTFQRNNFGRAALENFAIEPHRTSKVESSAITPTDYAPKI
jgi:hypothetical protein